MKKRYLIAAILGAIIGFSGWCIYDLGIKRQFLGDGDTPTVMEIMSSSRWDKLAAERYTGNKSSASALIVLLMLMDGIAKEPDLVIRIILFSGLASASSLLAVDHLRSRVPASKVNAKKRIPSALGVQEEKSDSTVISTKSVQLDEIASKAP